MKSSWIHPIHQQSWRLFLTFFIASTKAQVISPCANNRNGLLASLPAFNLVSLQVVFNTAVRGSLLTRKSDDTISLSKTFHCSLISESKSRSSQCHTRFASLSAFPAKFLLQPKWPSCCSLNTHAYSTSGLCSSWPFCIKYILWMSIRISHLPVSGLYWNPIFSLRSSSATLSKMAPLSPTLPFSILSFMLFRSTYSPPPYNRFQLFLWLKLEYDSPN